MMPGTPYLTEQIHNLLLKNSRLIRAACFP